MWSSLSCWEETPRSITRGQHQIQTAPWQTGNFIHIVSLPVHPIFISTCGLEQMPWGMCRPRHALDSNCLRLSHRKYREGSEMSSSPGHKPRTPAQGWSWEEHHGHRYLGDCDVSKVSTKLTNPEISVLHGVQCLLLWHSHPFLLFKSVWWILYAVFNTAQLQMYLKIIPYFLLMGSMEVLCTSNQFETFYLKNLNRSPRLQCESYQESLTCTLIA